MGEKALLFTQYAEFGGMLAGTLPGGSAARCCSCTAGVPKAGRRRDGRPLPVATPSAPPCSCCRSRPAAPG